MHICHLTSMHPWNDDRIFERACRMLARMGHRVTLIAPRMSGETIHGVHIIPLPKRSGWARRVIGSRDAVRLARGLDADIFHFHDPDLLPFMRNLAAEGRAVVYDVHENYVARFSMWGLPAGLANLLGRWFRSYERACTNRFAGVVAVSDSVLALFDGARREGCVVQNVPDCERFASLGERAERPGTPVIYTSGTHSDDRSCLQTIEAMPHVLEKHPDARFVFVGRYEPAGYRERLAERGATLGVSASLELEGLVPWEENFRRTAEAHIGCVFYSDNPNNRVTIPNRIFEYMVCGLAVAAHDFPELRSIVEGRGAGVLVDSGSPDSIARGLNHLLDHPEERMAMARRGRDAVLGHYNFRTQCESMAAMYTRILDSRD
jgi:glycosyltransferase involved in cell wall biosynthesis